MSDIPAGERRMTDREKRLEDKPLNEAKWAACNTRWDEGCVPTMEKASEVAENAVRAYVEAAEAGIATLSAEVADFLQEALDQTADMEEPHKSHMLRVKVLSRISALSTPEANE